MKHESSLLVSQKPLALILSHFSPVQVPIPFVEDPV